MGVGRASKENWFARLNELIDTYSSIFVVNIDNVSSQQMHVQHPFFNYFFLLV